MDVVFEFTRVVVSAVSKRCASAILEVARQNPRYTGKLVEMGQATNRLYVHLKYFSGRVLMPPGTPQFSRSNTGQQFMLQMQQQQQQQAQQQQPQGKQETQLPQESAAATSYRNEEASTGGGGGGGGAGAMTVEVDTEPTLVVAQRPNLSSVSPVGKTSATTAAESSAEEAPSLAPCGMSDVTVAAGGPRAATAAALCPGPRPPVDSPVRGAGKTMLVTRCTSGSPVEGSSRASGGGNTGSICGVGTSSSGCSSSSSTGTFTRGNNSGTLSFARPSSTLQQPHGGSNTGGQRPPQAKITLNVKPLDEDKALEVGAETLSDGLVMVVMLCLVAVGLYIRRLSAARSEARVRSQEEKLRLQYEVTQMQLDRVVAFLQEHFPDFSVQTYLSNAAHGLDEAAATDKDATASSGSRGARDRARRDSTTVAGREAAALRAAQQLPPAKTGVASDDQKPPAVAGPQEKAGRAAAHPTQ